MGDAAKNPFVLPIFDTNYTVDLVWPAGDTIDVGMLKKVISWNIFENSRTRVVSEDINLPLRSRVGYPLYFRPYLSKLHSN